MEAVASGPNVQLAEWLEKPGRFQLPLTGSERNALTEVLERSLKSVGIISALQTPLTDLARELAQKFSPIYRDACATSGQALDQRVVDHLDAVVSHPLSPHSCFRIHEHLVHFPDMVAWREGFLAVAVTGAGDNPFICHAFARLLAKTRDHQSASRWLQRTIGLQIRAIKSLAEDPNKHGLDREFWILGTFYKEISEDYFAAGDTVSAIRYRLLGHLTHVHQPDYKRLNEMLRIADHSYSLPDRPLSTQADILTFANLMAVSLGATVQRVSAKDIKGTESLEVFPGEMKKSSVPVIFGPAVNFPAVVRLNPGVIYSLSNVRCYVDLNKTAVITKSGFLVDELTHGPAEISYISERLNLLRADAFGLRKLHGDVALVSKLCAWEWYSHWLMEVLPMVGMLLEKKFRFDHLIALHSAKPYCNEGFDLLGINRENIVDGDRYVYASADRLIVPRSCTARSGETPVSDFAIGFVRNLFLGSSRSPTDTGRRIMISRKKANRRQLTNEDQLIELLDPYGFETVLFEDCSVRDAARIMSEASIVVGLHGAGMANTIFCRAGTKIIELFPPRANNWIQLQSGCCDLHYICVRCSYSSAETQDDIMSDVMVDLTTMKDVLAYAVA